jgi:alginate O-acetyltransferase complex protein AlgI
MFFKPIYILILFFTIIIDYIAGVYIEKQQDKRKKKKYLIISIVANVSVLAIFKYFNFINSNIDGLATFFNFKNPIPYLNILLPIGLSFHTFQAMSYTIEVYKGNQKAEKHFGIYALYVMYFPQLVAGPIERPQNVLHQFHEKHYFDINRTIDGLRLIMWGMFKKIVIADRLSLCANEVFNNVHYYKGGPLLLGIFFFTFQIYCDFSGYSDIARGSSRIMGIELMKNFNAPYLAKSIKEFWGRWHISLSTWFRDYLYIPLGGNRGSKAKSYRNVLIVFLVSGLWHGANWTFVVWGFVHGVFNTIGIAFKKEYQSFIANLKSFKAIGIFLSWLGTFIIVCAAWVFFRANSLNDAIYFFKNMYKIDLKHIISIPIFSYFYYISCFVFIILLFSLEYFYEKGFLKMTLLNNKIWNFTFFSVLFILIYVFGIFEKQSFIYFQF